MREPKILDNKQFGKVGDELKENINKGSKLSVISAYFTIYAFNELYRELYKIDKMRFIFTEPTFVKKPREVTRQYYINRESEKSISGNEFEIKMRNKLNQANIAKECANWLKDKVEIKSLKQPNPAQQRLIYIDNKEDSIAINGTVDFTTDGLGFTTSSRMDMNTCMYGKEYTKHFLQMFDRIWEDDFIVEDVKEKVLEQMQIIYKENTPEFIYFVTLYNIFKDYLDELTEENIDDYIVTMEEALSKYDAITVHGKYVKLLVNGVRVADNRFTKDKIINNRLYRVYDEDSNFIGLGERNNSGFKIEKLLIT